MGKLFRHDTDNVFKLIHFLFYLTMIIQMALVVHTKTMM